MRKAPILLISFVMAVSTIQAVAAVKPGTTCKKVGTTAISGGKKYTCVKSGKKLVWNKGVAVKPQQSLPSSAPTPIPNPQPSPSQQPGEQIKDGDPCEGNGETLNLQNKVFKCLVVARLKTKWVDYTNYNLDLTKQGFAADFTPCRIPDARTTKIQREAIAYPAIPDDPTFTSKSTITTAIVPIDFSDLVGTVTPESIYSKVISETDQWNQWFTRGNSKVNWVVYPKWIRAPKASSEYNWIHPLSMTAQVQDNSVEVGQELIDLAQTQLDLKGVQDILFIYPPEVTKIQDSINYQRPMTTKYGQQFLGVYATSLWSYKYQESLAMWLIHENMHRFGYAGHSPAWPPLFSIAHNQSGLSRVMDVWDRIVLDWINPGDIYCTSKEDLHGEEVLLVPEEREQAGIQGVAIKLSSHELLILESHKQDKWSAEYPSEFYGITAMYVDTSRDTDRSGENFGDDRKGTKFSRTATYVDLHDLNHGPAADGQISEGINYLLYQGESLTFKGIKVEFVKAGYNDRIKIEKVA